MNPSYARPFKEMRNVQSAHRPAECARTATPTSVTAGTLEVTATVNVSYELDYNAGDTKFLPAPQ
jgi:uncharacterized protein YggE